MKKENKREIEFIVPSNIKDFCIEKLRFDLKFKDLKVKSAKKIKLKDSKIDETVIVIKSEKDLDLNSIDLGARLNELKIQASGELHLKMIEEKSKEKQEPYKLKLPEEFAGELNRLFEKELKIKKITKIAGKSKEVNVFFDLDHIKGRTQLFAHVAKIMDCINTVKGNLKDIQDVNDMNRAIAVLEENCNYMQKTHISHIRLKGKELIEKGFASPFLLENQEKVSIWKQFFRLLKGKQAKANLEYYYMNRIVDLDKEYIVRLKNRIVLPEPQPVNHIQEVRDFYEYGEMMARGRGIVEVEKYYEAIIKKHNELVEAQTQEEGTQESNSE